MTAATQIAQKLFEAGVRLADQYDTGAVFRAIEPAQSEILAIWLASIDHDTDVTFNARDLRDKPAVQTHAQFLDALLWSRFEDMAYDKRNHFWQDVDAELWMLQKADEREALAYQRGIREPLGKMLGIAS